MRASKLTACACALALASSAAASPVTVNTLTARELSAASSTPSPPAAPATPEAKAEPEAVAAPAPQQKKKRNLFVRVITAPFRGLAKLFGGGGDKGAKVARVSVQITPKPAHATATRNPTQPQPATQSTQTDSSAVAPQPATRQSAVSHAASVARPAPAPTPATAANDAAERQQQTPFVPLIVGVPRDPLSQGRALFERGYLNEAIAELSIAAVSGTNLVEANNLLGLAYDRRGWHKQAREHYERALTVAPGDPQVLNNLGYSLYLDDRYDDALDKLKRAARLAPANQHIENNLALVYGRLRRYDEAFKHFARAGGELYARLQTGALLDFAGRDHEAIKHFEAARRLDPASSEALRRLITLYNRTGQRDKAEAAQQELDRPKTRAVS